MAALNATDGIELTIQLDGISYTRTYHRSDAVNNVIVLGRLSSTAPDRSLQPWRAADSQPGIGGFIVSPGHAAFVSPVMSRQHARLVFSGDNEVYMSDPPNHSHHGTYVARNGRTFRVDHPQLLQTGDVVTFGKTVHRGGQVYEPLSARMRILFTGANPQSFASYTGHGYSLPLNIDIDVDVEEDNDVYKDDEFEEHPSTHKFYAVQEVQDDSDDITSLPSPVFPRGINARHHTPSMMPGGFHGIPEEAPFSFHLPPPPCLFEPPIESGFLTNALPHHPHEFGAFLAAQSPLSILGPIFRGGPPSPPPVLPPIHQPRPRPSAAIQVNAEFIDVDAQQDSRDVIDVDAVGSPESSIREVSPFEDRQRSVSDGSDSDFQTDSRARSPEVSGEASGPSTPNSFLEEADKFKDVLLIVKDLTNKHDKLLAYRKQSKRRIVANKIQLDTKIASLQQNLALIRSKVETEQQGFASDLEKKKEDVMEDIDSRKRRLMDDLDVYEDDVTYEVDRVMEYVEELNTKTGEGKARIDEYVESVRKLKEELEASLKAQIDEVRAKGAGATEEIDQVVAGVKRKREGLDAEEPQPRGRSPSVAMSMSPEPELQQGEAELEIEATGASILSDGLTRSSDHVPGVVPLTPEPPRKRQKLDATNTKGPRAGRILGSLAATTVVVCWALGKIGEMSTMGDL